MIIVDLLKNPIFWVVIAIIFSLFALYQVNLEESTTYDKKICKNDEILCGTDCFVESSGKCMKDSNNNSKFCNNYNICVDGDKITCCEDTQKCVNGKCLDCPSGILCTSKCCELGQECVNGECCSKKCKDENGNELCCNDSCDTTFNICCGSGKTVNPETGKCEILCKTEETNAFCKDNQTCTTHNTGDGKIHGYCTNNGCVWDSLGYNPDSISGLDACSYDEKLYIVNDPESIPTNSLTRKASSSQSSTAISECDSNDCYSRMIEKGITNTNYDSVKKECSGNFDCYTKLTRKKSEGCPWSGTDQSVSCCTNSQGKFTGQVCPNNQRCFNGKCICNRYDDPIINKCEIFDRTTCNNRGNPNFTTGKCVCDSTPTSYGDKCELTRINTCNNNGTPINSRNCKCDTIQMYDAGFQSNGSWDLYTGNNCEKTVPISNFMSQTMWTEDHKEAGSASGTSGNWKRVVICPVGNIEISFPYSMDEFFVGNIGNGCMQITKRDGTGTMGNFHIIAKNNFTGETQRFMVNRETSTLAYVANLTVTPLDAGANYYIKEGSWGSNKASYLYIGNKIK